LAHHLTFQQSVFLLNAQRLPLDLTAVASSLASPSQQGLSPNVAIFSVRGSKHLWLQIPGGMSFQGTVRSDMNNPKNNGESQSCDCRSRQNRRSLLSA
jgi:hypothetical protein